MWCSNWVITKLLNLWKKSLLSSLYYRPLGLAMVKIKKETIFNRRLTMYKRSYCLYVTGIITFLCLSLSYADICEAKTVTKKENKVKVTTGQEPDLTVPKTINLEHNVKQKSRVDKIDGSIMETKEISGDVSWIRNDIVAVEYYNKGGQSKVMLVPLDDVTTTRRLQSLQDLKVGDNVKIEFTEDFEENEEGKKYKFKRKAKLVDLIRSVDEKGTPTKSTKKTK
jgi:hypothetical protein